MRLVGFSLKKHPDCSEQLIIVSPAANYSVAIRRALAAEEERADGSPDQRTDPEGSVA
jgi:hypothetical protein